MIIELKGVKVCCVIACSQKLWKKRSIGFQLRDRHKEATLMVRINIGIGG